MLGSCVFTETVLVYENLRGSDNVISHHIMEIVLNICGILQWSFQLAQYHYLKASCNNKKNYFERGKVPETQPNES